MNVLLVRHAIAEDKAEFAATGRPDSLRPLTEEGRRKMRAAAKGLAKTLPALDLLASSPLARAAQTAEILRKACPDAEPLELPALSPERDPRETLAWLKGRPRGASVALVGHEPSLGRLAGWLMSGEETALVAFKKGGAALLEFPGDVEAGRAVLRWLLTPSQLRRLGR